ncbi:MAG: hypothetical protein ACFCU1_01920, partial [Sumerlaeia bacterium]
PRNQKRLKIREKTIQLQWRQPIDLRHNNAFFHSVFIVRGLLGRFLARHPCEESISEGNTSQMV